MRTNIVIDERLVREAMRLSRLRTKRAVVDKALRDYVARAKQRRILELPAGELLDPDYDVRQARRRN